MKYLVVLIVTMLLCYSCIRVNVYREESLQEEPKQDERADKTIIVY